MGRLILVVVVALIALTHCEVTHLPSECKTISEIGGCDKYAECGVQYTDGTSGRSDSYPVIGHRQCWPRQRVDFDWRWKKLEKQ